MSNFPLVRFVLILSLIGLSSCATDYDPKRAKTVTGVDIGKREWKTITDSESVVYIFNPPYVSRIRANEGIIGRYQESIKIATGESLFYEQTANGFNTRYGIKQITMDIVKANRFYKIHAVTTNIDQIKEHAINGITYAYVFMHGKTRDCFIIYAVFGEASHYSSNSSGDQAIRGTECLQPGSSTPSNIQNKWFDLLGRIRFDGPKPGWTSN